MVKLRLIIGVLILIARMFYETNYPERSMNGSIRAGYEAADAVMHGV